jgi:DNA-binding PadR family transcriptional regulator
VRTPQLKEIILKVFGGREFYGYEVHKSLSSRGVEIEISRLYRILNEMLREGLLEGTWEKSHKGPRRRIYKIREKGKDELNKVFLDAIQVVHMFYGKYLMSLPPDVDVLSMLFSQLTRELKEQNNIACVTPQYTPMHEWFVQTAHTMSPRGHIYLIKPKSLQIDLKLDNLTIMNGSYIDVSLKKDFLDLLVIMDLPQKEALETALKEWCRVLNQSGKLKILTPTILLEKHEDPLTIGDFVEKYEHEIIEKAEMIDKEFLLKKLKSFFAKVEERRIAHMTIFQASFRK